MNGHSPRPRKPSGGDARPSNILPSRTWRHWASVAGFAWFLVSLYPVLLYLSGATTAVGNISTGKTSLTFSLKDVVPLTCVQGGSKGRMTRAQAHATITRTIEVPPIHRTALPGSLDHTEYNPARLSDVVNTFRNFKQDGECSFSSLDLHGPFEPLCQDRASVLEAMSYGGRIGFDAPFSPRGCDMRWFSGEEICEIMTRFEKIMIVGDSTMRNLAVALHVYLRADLIHGGRVTWVEDEESRDCHCSGPFDASKCQIYSTVNSRVVWDHDPQSMICNGVDRGGFDYHAILKYPIDSSEISDFKDKLRRSKPKKPYAFIISHGLWNDLELDVTHAWLDEVEGVIKQTSPWLAGENAYFPRLFMGPNAAGIRKPEIFLARQGNIALSKFELNIGPFVRERGYDFLGTYNATIQSNNPDGTHGGMRNNMIKAMMALNWLNALDTSKYRT